MYKCFDFLLKFIFKKGFMFLIFVFCVILVCLCCYGRILDWKVYKIWELIFRDLEVCRV